MKKSGYMTIGILALCLMAGCASKSISTDSDAGDGQFSGFLADYSNLKPIKEDNGGELRRWITSSDPKGMYPKLLGDPVVFYPAPEATDQVSVVTLYGLRRYADTALRRELAKFYVLVERVGSGVARVRLALTGVSTEAKGLSGFEYTPLSAIVAGISTATGHRDRIAFLIV